VLFIIFWAHFRSLRVELMAKIYRVTGSVGLTY